MNTLDISKRWAKNEHIDEVFSGDRVTAPNKHYGFTLIELLTVSAVLGVLALYAISAYSGYTIRAKLTEIFAVSGPNKTMLAEACITTGAMPTDAQGASILNLDSDQSRYVSAVIYSRDATDSTKALIEYTLFDVDSSLPPGSYVEILGTCGAGNVTWDCLGSPGVDRLLPKSC